MSRSRVPLDEIFNALDGRCLSVDGHDWNVCVFSVTDANEHCWVQLALDGSGRQVLTLRLASIYDPEQALDSLSCFLTDPFATRDVLSHVA